MLSLCGIDEISALSQIFEKRNIEVGIYKKYILGMIFYTFLSSKQEKFLNEELNENNLSFEDAYEKEDMKENLKEKATKKHGYFIQPRDTFQSIINSIKNGTFSLEQLDCSLNNIKNSFSWKHPNKEVNIFNLMNCSQQDKLSRKEWTELITEFLLKISENNYLNSNITSFIHRLYDNLESTQHEHFYINSFYINQLLYDLIKCNGRKYENVLDASCNLNRGHDFLYPFNKIFGTDFEVGRLTCTCDDYYNQCILSMYPLMYDIKKDFLINDKKNSHKSNEKYDLIINTYGYNKENMSNKNDNKEMSIYADIKYLLNKLDEGGMMTIILPTEYIFNETSPFIDYMKEKVLDTIIKLPRYNNQNYTILIFKKNTRNTFLIDASYIPNFRIPIKSKIEDEDTRFFLHPDISKKFKDIIESYVNRREKINFAHNIIHQELNYIPSLKNYNIISYNEEDDFLNPHEKELKHHRFPAPPWIKYPKIPLGSMWWRQGPSEYYLEHYRDYIDDNELYEKLFPKPMTWNRIRQVDESISPELKKFIKRSGGKYKFFTNDGKPTHTINYESKTNIKEINDTVFDLKYPYTFPFASMEYTAYTFIEEEKNKDWGVNGKPTWDEVKYTLCLNANYSKIVSDKKLVDKLLKTGDKLLIYLDDSEWGVQKQDDNIKGENLQGLALMQVRDEIRKVYENYDIIDWDITNNI